MIDDEMIEFEFEVYDFDFEVDEDVSVEDFICEVVEVVEFCGVLFEMVVVVVVVEEEVLVDLLLFVEIVEGDEFEVLCVENKEF